MKPLSIIIVLFGFFFARNAGANAFQVADYGLTIEMPTGWIHDAEDQFGFVLYDPKVPAKKRKVRIHFPAGNASTPEAQVQASLDFINKGRRDRGQDLERIQYQKPVTTRSGLEGFMASHGFEGEADKRYINHYYFKTHSGKILCVCVYLTGASTEDEARLENIILNSITFDE